MTPGEWVIEGHLLADARRPGGARRAWRNLHAGMDDGRRLEVFVLDDAGRLVNVEGTTFIVP